MINLLKSVVRSSSRSIRKDDIFLVSYPKSGNTWLKFIFASYIKEREVAFNEVHNIIPEYETQSRTLWQLSVCPRIIKSHSVFTDKFPKVIYIVRDGRDVLVSYFFYLKKTRVISADTSFASFLEEYNRDNLPHGKWEDHVYSWLSNKSHNIEVVFYEDMLKDSHGEAKRAIAFSGMPVCETRLANAVEHSSFGNLSRLEQRDKYVDKHLVNTDHKIPFVRNGKAGSYTEFFTKEESGRFLESRSKVYDLIDKFRSR